MAKNFGSYSNGRECGLLGTTYRNTSLMKRFVISRKTFLFFMMLILILSSCSAHSLRIQSPAIVSYSSQRLISKRPLQIQQPHVRINPHCCVSSFISPHLQYPSSSSKRRKIPGNLSMSTQKQSHSSQTTTTPNHIAIIPDGNARWARSHSLPLSMGHAKGSQRVISTIRHLHSRGVECVTIYIFSTENWNRSMDEINQLWKLLETTIVDMKDDLKKINIKLIGDYDDDRLPLVLRNMLRGLECVDGDDDGETTTTTTPQDKKLTLGLAINYGGRQDIIKAAQRIAANDDGFDEQNFRDSLSTRGMPPVDLVIRTGGERRLSNFLLWDVAYAELYFSDVLWPNFDEEYLDEALSWFESRERRFGGRAVKIM